MTVKRDSGCCPAQPRPGVISPLGRGTDAVTFIGQTELPVHEQEAAGHIPHCVTSP